MLAYASAQSTLAWKFSNEWLSKDNWKSGQTPQAGQIVSFPPSFTTFGEDFCASSAACVDGPVVSVTPQASTSITTVQVGGIQLPPGKLQFKGDVVFQFLSDKANDNLPSAAIWDDHGPNARDLTCANNWVVAGTSSNPSFAVPCFNTKAQYPTGATFQIEADSIMYTNASLFPTSVSTPFFNDRYQFQGIQPSSDMSTCPQPLSANTGPQYCQMSCINSCPELNPSPLAAARTSLNYINSLLPHIDEASAAGLAALAIVTKPIQINGAIAFTAPSGTSASVLETVSRLIMSDLPASIGYNISFQCSISSDLSGVACSALATIANSKKFALTSKAVDPFTFTEGILTKYCGELVDAWFVLQSELEQATRFSAYVSPQAYTLALQVPSRVITDLGSTLYSPETSASFATALQVPASNVHISKVFASGDNLHTIILLVVPIASTRRATFSPSSDEASLLLTDPENPVVLEGSNGPIPMYDPAQDTEPVSVSSPGVVTAQIVNTELSASLPLSADASAAEAVKVIEYLNGVFGLGSDILRVEFARGTIQDDAILVTIFISGTSDLKAVLVESPDAFDSYVYGTSASLTLSVSASTVAASVARDVNSELATINQAVNEQTSLANLASTTLRTNGAPADVIAVGSYSWTDLGITDDGSTLPSLTNAQCASFTSAVTTQAALKALLTTEMAKVLPVTQSAITITIANITCRPFSAAQTRDNQRAVFSLSFTLSGSFTLFALGASYVTLPLNVAIVGQFPESTAPLGLRSVRSATQNALRRVFVPLYKTAKVAEAAMFSNMLTTVAPATTAAGSDASSASASSVVPMIGAAVGGIILIVVVVVILVRRKASTANPRKSGPTRNVVAFENPIYADKSNPNMEMSALSDPKGESLYDEPESRPINKDNPVYESTERLVNSNRTSGVFAEEQPVYEEEPTAMQFDQHNANPTFDPTPSFEPEPVELADAGYLDVGMEQESE